MTPTTLIMDGERDIAEQLSGALPKHLIAAGAKLYSNGKRSILTVGAPPKGYYPVAVVGMLA